MGGRVGNVGSHVSGLLDFSDPRFLSWEVDGGETQASWPCLHILQASLVIHTRALSGPGSATRILSLRGTSPKASSPACSRPGPSLVSITHDHEAAGFPVDPAPPRVLRKLPLKSPWQRTPRTSNPSSWAGPSGFTGVHEQSGEGKDQNQSISQSIGTSCSTDPFSIL